MNLQKYMTIQFFSYFVVFGSFFPLIFAYSEECQSWFERKGVEKGTEDCLIECSMLETDMGTFHCPEKCNKLCKKKLNDQIYLIFSKVYPTLTQTEKDLVAKYPKKMLIAYKIYWEAENLCLTLFERSKTNDESDACRHFVGATLLYKKFGQKFSEKILEAHEQNLKQLPEEKLMDMANNNLGLTVASDLQKKNKLNKEQILRSFQKNIKEGKLIVIKEGAKKKSKSAIRKLWNKLKGEKL